ncbi:urease accessory protein UreH domain-containing protein [Planktothrix agardhii]|uniref:urease accessory protein UreH domain-containing protein n=1 Tax=Planktothrix agardhii TaxID=1160 RepID=UPI000DBB15DF|nr:sulfite exporter TauE/SafE family protein [Planktothrix agardhii]BBD53573.1 ferric reductase domain-containing protein [Planktothrix agardhii NIES-204]
MIIDVLLIGALGFLGSFGHCLGMCGPLTVAFSVSDESLSPGKIPWQFHLLLNFGRILSYALIGAMIGGLGSVLIAGGQMAGIGSIFRQGMAIFTGILLIILGLAQINPTVFRRFPIIHPLSPKNLHNYLSKIMVNVSLQNHVFTPILLGLIWGLIPCGFLYTAQIKAAETGNLGLGMLTMLAFGLGTFPTMLGVGLLTGKFTADRRGQLFRLGGWITLLIGILTLLRTGNHVDYTGYGSLISLMFALIARPISRLWSQPLKYRRFLGVGAFVLAIVHTVQMLDHTFQWNLTAFEFMIPQHQLGIIAGGLALLLMIPAAITSFDHIQNYLGIFWRRIHLLAVPALIFIVIHALFIGSNYFGRFDLTFFDQLRGFIFIIVTLMVLLIRYLPVWSILGLEKFYVAPLKQK